MVTSRGDFAFEEVLPRLVAAYETGRLVPFIGSGELEFSPIVFDPRADLIPLRIPGSNGTLCAA
jgi:hypothetical protein